jgi:SPP1 family predicted phage head-tail adaptor
MIKHPGELRDRVWIYEQTQTVDDARNIVTAWAPLFATWASMGRKSAEQAWRAGRDEGLRNFECVIRWRSGIGTNNRLQFRGRNFDIQGALNHDGRRQYLTLYLLERDADGDDGAHFAPALDFSDARNSQYLAALGL